MDWLVGHFAAIVFWVLAAVTVAGAVGVVAFRQPVHAALSLLTTFLSIAGLFVLAHAEFLAAVQVLVYAGGVMVLFLFVIMLVNVQSIPKEPQYVRRLLPVAGVLGAVLALLVGFGVWGTLTGAPAPVTAVIDAATGAELGNTEAVGLRLYRDYLLPFEVVSVVLLVAMIGAIVMGRKEQTDTERA